MPRECLILFTRYPDPGTTKTRLIPVLGRRGAADLQRRMSCHVMAQAAPLTGSRGLELEVRYTGGDRRVMRDWLGNRAVYRRQGEGDIGRRMSTAFREAMHRGRDAVVVIGSDIPGITTLLLEQAFQRLDHRTIVLGPASDGGYYLIGLTPQTLPLAQTSLFTGMHWGTPRVLAETCRRIAREKLAYDLLDVLDDVDRPEDLSVWERYRRP